MANKKPTKPAPETPNLDDATIRRNYDTILELGKDAEAKAVRMVSARETANEAKKDWEASVAALQGAIRRARDPQRELAMGDD